MWKYAKKSHYNNNKSNENALNVFFDLMAAMRFSKFFTVLSLILLVPSLALFTSRCVFFSSHLILILMQLQIFIVITSSTFFISILFRCICESVQVILIRQLLHCEQNNIIFIITAFASFSLAVSELWVNWNWKLYGSLVVVVVDAISFVCVCLLHSTDIMVKSHVIAFLFQTTATTTTIHTNVWMYNILGSAQLITITIIMLNK